LFVPREWEATCPASPHLWTSFEDSSGARLGGGYGGDCSPIAQTIRERMNKEAVLLKPGDHLDGTFLLDTKLFGGLKPGAYRVEAALTGWDEEKLTAAERSELARMGSPFMAGEVPDSIRITLTPSAKGRWKHRPNKTLRSKSPLTPEKQHNRRLEICCEVRRSIVDENPTNRAQPGRVRNRTFLPRAIAASRTPFSR